MNHKQQHIIIINAGNQIINTIWLHPKLYWFIVDKLKPENFPLKSQQDIYEAMQQLTAKGHAINDVTIGQYLQENDKFDSYIKAKESGFAGNISKQHSINERELAVMINALHGQWVRGQLKESANELLTKLRDPTKSPFELLGEAQVYLDNISQNVESNRKKDLSDISQDFDESMQKARDNDGQTGVDLFGIGKLDMHMSGGESGDLIIVGGRSGQGKSSLQNSAAAHFVKTGMPGLFWSLEMPNRETYGRIVSALTGINYTRLKKGHISEAEQESVYQAYEQINASKIVLEDRAGISMLDIKAKIAQIRSITGLEAAFIDRLGLLNHLPGTETLLKVDKIGETTKMGRLMAMEYDMPLVLYCQLKRPKDKSDVMPRLEDLRSSGHIEQDAKKVVFIFRPEYYGLEDYEGYDSKELGVAMIAKNSNGPTVDTLMRFNAQQMYFSDHPTDVQELQTVDTAIVNSREVDEDLIPF